MKHIAVCVCEYLLTLFYEYYPLRVLHTTATTLCCVTNCTVTNIVQYSQDIL